MIITVSEINCHLMIRYLVNVIFQATSICFFPFMLESTLSSLDFDTLSLFSVILFLFLVCLWCHLWHKTISLRARSCRKIIMAQYHLILTLVVCQRQWSLTWWVCPHSGHFDDMFWWMWSLNTNKSGQSVTVGHLIITWDRKQCVLPVVTWLHVSPVVSGHIVFFCGDGGGGGMCVCVCGGVLFLLTQLTHLSILGDFLIFCKVCQNLQFTAFFLTKILKFG